MFPMMSRLSTAPVAPAATAWLALCGCLVAFACDSKETTIETGDTAGEEEGSTPEQEVVWDDLSLESSVTLAAGFASGAGFYAIGEDGEVYVRSEGEWRQEGVNSEEPLNGIWGVRTADVNYAMAVGDGGLVARLDEVGWATAQELNTANMEGVTSIDGSTYIAVGWGGAYIYEEGSWNFQNMGGNPQFNDVWSDGTTTVAVGQDGLIATSNATGEWSLENLPSRVALYGVSGTGRNDLWVVGENGTVLHNVGEGWEPIDIGTSTTLWSVLTLSSDATYIVGNSGTAVRHDGSDVSVLPTGVDNNLYDITASQGGVVWAVGNRGATLRLQSGY
jgi:hypothetical protein